MRRPVHFLTFLAFFSTFYLISGIALAQNGLVGSGFGNNDWSTTDDFTGSAGSSRIGEFTANNTNNQYFRLRTNWDSNNNEWGPSTESNYQVYINTEVNASEILENNIDDAYYINVGSTAYNYIFKTKEGGNFPTNKGLIVFEVQGAIRSVSGVSASLSTIYPGQSVTITATLDDAFNTGQGVYLRYTNDDFSTSGVAEMTGSGTSYTASIPSSVNGASKTVKYYVFTSGNGLSITGDKADWYTINLNNVGGTNYSYTVKSSWITAANGNWSSDSTWNGNAVPPDNQPVTIDHDITLDQNAIVSSITINSGKTFTASDNSSRTLTINSNANGTTLTNNGTWVQGNGGNTVVFSAGADMTHTVSGEIPFHHVTISRSSGIPAVGVNFGSNSTVSGTLKLTVGSYVNTNAPTYLSGSYLQYSIGGAYDRNVEWSQNSGNAYPHHVKISDNTTLNAFNGTTSPRQIAGNLIIDNGSTFSMGNMDLGGSYDVGIIIGGDTLLNKGTVTLSASVERLQCNTYLGETGSTLILSGVYGGDLELKGDYTNLGNFTSNSRALFFTGSAGDQNITFSGGQQFDYMIVDKNAGNVVLGNDIQINKLLTLTSGLITSKTGNSYSVIMGDSPDSPSIKDASAVSYIDGKLRQTFTSAMPLQYPVGRGGEYRPVTFEYASLTGTSYVMVEHVDVMQPGSIQEGIWLLEDRHWEVTQSGGSSFTYKITLDPNISDALGNIMIGKYENSTNTWHATTSPNYTNLTPFTTLSGTNAFALAEDCTIEVLGDNDTTCYPTLQSAFQAINNGLHTGNIKVLVHGNSTETSTATLNASGSGSASYSSVTIYPTAPSLTISGNINGPLINLNGVDSVIIDGSVNGTGSTADLQLINTSTSNVSNTSTILFSGSATQNIVKYCQIQGSGSHAESGIILFSESSGTGNDNNILESNSISGHGTQRPINAIYAASEGSANGNNKILKNQIFNILNPSTSSTCVHLSVGNESWSIEENSFYESTPLSPVSAANYSIIRIESQGGDNFRINGNYIGGSSPNCSDTLRKRPTHKNRFSGIYVDAISASIQNNTIKNISWADSLTSDWVAIRIISGKIRVGDSVGNTIGSATGNSSIFLTYKNTSSLGRSYGIYSSSTDSVFISNNVIGSITASHLDQRGHNLYGIYRDDVWDGYTVVSKNRIGSETSINSLWVSSTVSGGETDDQKVVAVYNGGDGLFSVQENVIKNITNSALKLRSAINSGNLESIGINVVSGSNHIQNNTISDIYFSAGTDPGDVNLQLYPNSAIVTGLKTYSNIIKENSISNLTNSNTEARSTVIGIFSESGGFDYGTTSIIDGNFIHSLNTSSIIEKSNIIGLKTGPGIGQNIYKNNIVLLGKNNNHPSLSIIGIDETTPGNNSILHNTIFIDGEVIDDLSDSAYSFAIKSANSYDDRILKNNLFYNHRKNLNPLQKNKHIAIEFSPSGIFQIDNNDYYADGVGGIMGNILGDGFKYNIDDWKLATGQDDSSIVRDPSFDEPGQNYPEAYIPQYPVNLPGARNTGVTDDFGGDIVRPEIPTMGAWEIFCQVIIEQQPADSIRLCSGADTVISVVGAGTGDLFYQWQVRIDDGVNWNDITNGGVYSNVTTANLKLTGIPFSFNNNLFRCKVYLDCGSEEFSAFTILKIDETPATSPIYHD